MQDGFLLRRGSRSCGPAAQLLGRKEGQGCHSGSTTSALSISWHPQWCKCPAQEFTSALLGTVSSLWHWDVCMACTISLFCFLMAFLSPISHCCCTCASPTLYPRPVCTCAQFVPVQAPVCTRALFVPVQALTWDLISALSCAPHCLYHQECPPGTSPLWEMLSFRHLF